MKTLLSIPYKNIRLMTKANTITALKKEEFCQSLNDFSHEILTPHKLTLSPWAALPASSYKTTNALAELEP